MYSSDSARVFKVPGHSVVYSRDQASVFKVPAWSQCSVFKGLGQCIQGIVQELCESRGGRPGLSVLTSLLVSVDVKIYCTVLRHWSQLVPNMSTDI